MLFVSLWMRDASTSPDNSTTYAYGFIPLNILVIVKFTILVLASSIPLI